MGTLRFLLVAAALLFPTSASAVSVRDIIELARAGLPDDVLVAVIDADRTIFTLDKEQILELKKAGVSNTVLLKMLRTGREFETAQTRLMAAIERVTAEGIHTPDLGGKATTAEVTKAVRKAIVDNAKSGTQKLEPLKQP